MSQLVSDQTLFIDRSTPYRSPSKERLEGYLDRVAKSVPIEIVLAYITIQSVFGAAGTAGTAGTLPAVQVVFYGLLVMSTGPYLIRFGAPVPDKRRQAVLGALSFVVWTYGIGGTFFWGALESALHTKVQYPSVAGGLVVLWSLAIGLVGPARR